MYVLEYTYTYQMWCMRGECEGEYVRVRGVRYRQRWSHIPPKVTLLCYYVCTYLLW